MGDFLKKHPAWAAFTAILLFLVVSLPVYLGTIWPILEWARIVTPLPPGQTLPQWITEQRWPGMSPALFSWVTLGSILGMFAFLGAIIHAVRQNRREVGWLETLADQDSQDMSNRIETVASSYEIIPFLDVVEPYIDFRIGFTNTTVYFLTLVEREGKFTYHGSPLQQQPEVIGGTYELKHAQYRLLVLRQFLQPDTARQIRAEGTEVLKTVLETGRFALWFTYQDRFGASQRVRKAL